MEEQLLNVLINLVITAVAYMAFPLIRIAVNHGRFEKSEAKKIALWNSIIVSVAFFVIRFATSMEAGTSTTWSIAPAVAYYMINCALLTKNNRTSTVKVKSKSGTADGTDVFFLYDFQRAGMMKRIPAWMLDMILLITLATGLISVFAAVFDWDASAAALNDVYTRYEQEYDISFGVTDEELAAMDEAELAKYEAASEALSKDADAQKAFEMILNLTLLVAALSFLGAFLILEFLVPLWLKNGQTLGKKCFGVALMRKDGVKVTPFMMFARTVLGKYTIETMIPVLFLIMLLFGFMGLEGLILCAAILLAQIIVPLVTRNKTAIHDLLACTVAVDLSSQMIFDSPEQMEAYHEEIRVNKASEEE